MINKLKYFLIASIISVIFIFAACGTKNDIDYANENDVDIYDALEFIDLLGVYMTDTNASANEFAQKDLLYFAVTMLRDDLITQQSEIYADLGAYELRIRNEYNTLNNEWDDYILYWDGFVVPKELVDMYIFACFGLDGSYSQKYIDGVFDFGFTHNYFASGKNQFLYDYYDADDGMFYFAQYGSKMRYANLIPREGMRIDIDGAFITIRAGWSQPNANTMHLFAARPCIPANRTYELAAHYVNGKIFYMFVSCAETADDDAGVETFVIPFCENEVVEFTAPWIIVNRGGEVSYAMQNRANADGSRMGGYGFGMNWDDYSPLAMAKLIGVNGTTAYLDIAYHTVCDMYVYDIAEREGVWLPDISASGTYGAFPDADFSTRYADELAQAKKIIGEYYAAGIYDRPQVLYYGANQALAMPTGCGHVLVRRSAHYGAFTGSYYIINTTTGEETYICDSYTREYLISYMEESFVWLDDTHAQVIAYLSGRQSYTVFDCVLEYGAWVITEVDADSY